MQIPEVESCVNNIDLLSQRYEKLIEIKVPCEVRLIQKRGNEIFVFQAFMAEGGKMAVDGYTHYTEVADTLSVALLYYQRENDNPVGVHHERFSFHASKEGGYLVNYPSGMRIGMWPEWYVQFETLFSYFEKLNT